MSLYIIKTKLCLEPDLKTNKISGNVTYSINVDEPTKSIILHSKSIDIRSVEAIRSSFYSNKNILNDYSLNDKTDELILNLNKLIKGKINIEISFISHINNEFVGFYKSNVKNNGEFLLVTQFFETDARRAFPCFDLPIFKSSFNVTLIIEKNLDAVFNTDILSENSFNQTKKIIKFVETPRMPPSLLFFGIGKLDILESTYKGKKFRIIAERPKATEHGSFALKVLEKSFLMAQEYFEISYPISKLDLFMFDSCYGGAMENWGIISILENISLYFEDLTSQSAQDTIQIVIAHETTHQWFGDLVSPSDYKKYIWLNESFATYFSYNIVKKNNEGKPIWEKFLKDQFIQALFRDSFISTVSIELPGDAVQGIDVLTAPIVYNKGACVLRQLEDYMGSETFRKGLIEYIKTFAYKNASSNDLWKTLEKNSGLSILEFMNSWIRQPGHPFLSTTVSGSNISLKQERFRFIQNEKSDQFWLIPVKVILYMNNGSLSQEYLLKDLNDQFDLKLNSERKILFYYIDDKVTGFFRVLYDDLNLSSILENNDRLSPKQKFKLLTDYFAFFIAKKISLHKYLEIISTFKDEYSYLCVTTILEHLKFIHLHVNEKLFTQIIEIGKEYLQSIINFIHLNVGVNDSEEIIEIRSEILPLLFYYNIPEVLEFGILNYNKIIQGESIDSNLINGCLFLGAKKIKDLKTLIEKYKKVNIEEMKLRYAIAIANIDYYGTNEVFDFCINLLEERHMQFFFKTLSENKSYNGILFDFVVDNFNFFSNKNPLLMQIVLYFLIINSKVQVTNVKKFIKDKLEKNKELENVCNLIIEELTVYNGIYQMDTLNLNEE